MRVFSDFFSTTLAEIGVTLPCEVSRKMSLKNREFWKFDFRFWQNFDPHYLKTFYSKGTPSSCRVVEKKSETLAILGRVRFGFVLMDLCPFKENEYRSEHLVGIFEEFFDFLIFTLGYNSL